MNKKNVSKRLWIVAVLGLIMVLQCTNAFARDRDRGGDRDRGRSRYSSHDSRLYRPGWFWFNVALFHPPVKYVVVPEPRVCEENRIRSISLVLGI